MQASARSIPSQASFWLAFAACTIAALIPLWSVKYLPMVDLPQHTAQVSIWIHYHNPAFGFAGQFELNWFTPYLGGYAFARLVAFFFPLLVSMKIVATLVVLALPATLFFLLRWTEGDYWWTLAGFPLAFGYNFCWGFLNYILAIPLGILFVGLGYSYAKRATSQKILGLCLLSLSLFWAHLYVLIFSCLVVGLFVLNFSKGTKVKFLKMLPLGASLPLITFWVWKSIEAGAKPSYKNIGDFGFHRLTDFPGNLFGFPEDGLASLFGLILLAILIGALIERGGLRKECILWIPSLLAAGIYFLVPHSVMGIQYTYQRFAVFVVLLAFIAVSPKVPSQFHRLRCLLLLIIVLSWISVLAFRYRGFNIEARDFDVVSQGMSPNKKVMALIFDRTSEAVPGSVFLHFANYYQAEKGGSLVFSPAIHFHVLARYNPGAQPPFVRPGFEWYPEAFDGNYHKGYDYFLIRTPTDPRSGTPASPEPFITDRARVPIRFIANKGKWWLYERTSPPKS